MQLILGKVSFDDTGRGSAAMSPFIVPHCWHALDHGAQSGKLGLEMFRDQLLIQGMPISAAARSAGPTGHPFRLAITRRVLSNALPHSAMQSS